MRVAIASYKKQEKLAQGVTNDEDAELIAFLISKNLEVVSAIWDDEKIDWSYFHVVVIKSPWDYHNHINRFLAWLDKLEELRVKVLNPVKMIRWNSHKRYLKEIAENGLPVIPVEYLERGDVFDGRFFDLFGTEKLVIKPCVSAGAQNTITIHRNNFQEHIDGIGQLLKEQDYMIQPFVAEIKRV